MVPVLIAVLLLSIPVWAQQGVKIGFVDLQKAIHRSKAGQSARVKFEARLNNVEASLLKEQKELERLKADLEKKSLLLNKEQKKELERELQRRYRDYQRTMADSRQELRQREREAMDQILRGIEKAAAELGKKENFSLILTREQLLYVDQGIDITDRVVRLYDRNAGGVSAKSK